MREPWKVNETLSPPPSTDVLTACPVPRFVRHEHTFLIPVTPPPCYGVIYHLYSCGSGIQYPAQAHRAGKQRSQKLGLRVRQADPSFNHAKMELVSQAKQAPPPPTEPGATGRGREGILVCFLASALPLHGQKPELVELF